MGGVLFGLLSGARGPAAYAWGTFGAALAASALVLAMGGLLARVAGVKIGAVVLLAAAHTALGAALAHFPRGWLLLLLVFSAVAAFGITITTLRLLLHGRRGVQVQTYRAGVRQSGARIYDASGGAAPYRTSFGLCLWCLLLMSVSAGYWPADAALRTLLERAWLAARS